MGTSEKYGELLADVDNFFLSTPRPPDPANFDGYIEADDDSSSFWEKGWLELTLEDFEISTFTLSDCYPEARVFFFGLVMKLSVQKNRYDIEPLKNMFFVSQKNRKKPITERDSFLKNFLTNHQKKIFLKYCNVALENSDPEEKSYWSNLLGEGWPER
ncbi:hypothetical protein JI58_08415 [Marinosulfonomonas sp. PRT-SC04]|nr:hypothetical protein JI58_08415 [Marinosulfonomonas sp. PRT-SC04]